LHRHREVHFVLFGRELGTNESVAIHFRYCPYLVIKELTSIHSIAHSNHDTISRIPLNGFTENTIDVHRVFVPMKDEWYRVTNGFRKNLLGIELLDYHQTLDLQMRLVLGLKSLDVVSIEESQLQVSTERHTNVKREYTIWTRLDAQNRDKFPILVSPEEDFITKPTIMSFDVEAYSPTGAFPTASNSFTITICQTTRNLGGDTLTQGKFMLNVGDLQTEKSLLESFSKAIIEEDPDMITGWNTHNFDWPYLLERAKRVGASSFPYIDRVRLHKTCMTTFGQKQPTFPGRVVFDSMKVMIVHLERTDKKPERYSLENISNVILGKGKMDLSIPEMRRAYEDGRYDVVSQYCLKDTELPLEILHKEGMVTLLFQLASISGVSLHNSFKMTNSSLVIATLSFEVFENNYVYDLPRPDKTSKFQGAYVHEPKPGLYESAAVLDFASLYPSIAISYNFCYTTLTPLAIEGKTLMVELPQTQQAHFVQREHRAGLLPATMQKFQNKRAAVKREMKVCKDVTKRMVLDSRQKGIKTISNSFYGLTGANQYFGMQVIAESITAFGRMAIKKTQNHLEDNMKLRVVAMDTDSCFVLIDPTMSVDNAESHLQGLCSQISKDLFDGKLTLEYEKQLRPLLLVAKKKYMGYDPKPGPGEDSMLMKGLASKRRDTMPFARTTFKNVLDIIRLSGCSGSNTAAKDALQYVRDRFQLLTQMDEKHLDRLGLNLEDFVITSKIKHKSDYNKNQNPKYTFPIGYRVNQMLENPLGPGERVSFVHYYDKNQQNDTKRPNIIPLILMKNKKEYKVDALKVLEQHNNELRQYFVGISIKVRNEFDCLFRESMSEIKLNRGMKNVKNYIIRELNRF
jgi:DNA polymerase Pol2